MKRGNAGREALIQMVIILPVIAALAFWQRDFIKAIYFHGQASSLGLVLNAVIVGLFVVGIIKLIISFLVYSREERNILLFVKSRQQGSERLARKIDEDSLIGERFMRIRDLHERNVPINHGIISSIMMAEAGRNLNFPRFVNNILILAGVFGTIISLLLALAGASDVLDSVSGEGMELVLHGMNTALTTTATAIVAYFIYTYFFHKLLSVHSTVFARLEDAVLTYVVPEFAYDSDTTNRQIFEVVGELAKAVQTLRADTDGIAISLEKMSDWSDKQNEQLNKLGLQLENMTVLLAKGFRIDV